MVVNAADHPWKPKTQHRFIAVLDAAHTAGLIDALMGVESRAKHMKRDQVRTAYEMGYLKGQEDLTNSKDM